MEAYFDNSATTRVFDSVKDIVVKTMTEDYGNPSAKHRKGMEAEQYVRQAAADIAKTLKVRDKEILFTSGGTESNNMALIGTAMANQRAGKHIISTRIEHASVYNPLAYLEQQGFEVTYLSVDSQGHISLEELEAAIRQDTILVSIMYVNNEVGAIEPVEQIASLIHGKKPSILFHVDAIQAYGKLIIRPKKQGIDLLSVSAHKIHGPKGVGFLYIDEKVKIRPLLYGGGQQKDMRSGTENVPGIAGMGRAAREIYILTASLGIGCAFSAIPVGLFQGSITLLAVFIEPILTTKALEYLSMTGSMLIFCVGINLVFGKKFEVANMLPVLLIAVLFAYVPSFD